jgi:tRNA threonylcarbamoyladenosine biosynthesis protein TsaB
MIAIETLDMMAAGFLNDNPEYKGLICPMIDARRMEVYTKVLDTELNIIEDTNAKIIDENSFADILNQNQITFLGDGAEKCAETLKHHNSSFNQKNYNSAANMSKLANLAFAKGDFENMAYFEPFYLKDFVFTTPKKKV